MKFVEKTWRNQSVNNNTFGDDTHITQNLNEFSLLVINHLWRHVNFDTFD